MIKDLFRQPVNFTFPSQKLKQYEYVYVCLHAYVGMHMHSIHKYALIVTHFDLDIDN